MLSKLTTIQAIALLAVTAEAHYYSQTDALFDREVQNLNKQTQDVYDEINRRQNAADFAENEAAVSLVVANAQLEAAAAMADRVKVEAALAWVRQELTDIQGHQAAAEAAQLAAETAQSEAETAQTAAEDAQADAEEAKTAAELAETNAQKSQADAKTAQGNALISQSNASDGATNASGFQSTAEIDRDEALQASSDASDLRDETSDAATAAEQAGTAAKGFGDAALASGSTADEKFDEAGTSGTDAEAARDAAVTARDEASNHADLALYNSWGTIEDHDYNFLTYGIWGEGTAFDNFGYLEAQEIISSSKVEHDVYFNGVTYTADDGAKCQTYGNVCHGSGEFVKDGVTHYVKIHKGRVFRVYENRDYSSDGDGDTLYYCHEDSCDNYHGPWSSSGKQQGDEAPFQNYLYNDDDIVGYSDDVDGDSGVKGLLFEKKMPPGETFPLNVSALANVCEYLDQDDTDEIASDYTDYCSSALLNAFLLCILSAQFLSSLKSQAI